MIDSLNKNQNINMSTPTAASNASTLSLKISVPEKNVIKTIYFDPSILVFHAMQIIREKLSELPLGPG